MPFLQTRSGHDWGKPNHDALAIFYIAFAAVYSVIICLGLGALFLYRNTPAVRLRGFASICWTVWWLHVYLVLVLVAYPVNGKYKCGVEFWIMSTILPFGIALFQASNVRLLSYYEEQRLLAKSCYLDSKYFTARKKQSGRLSAWWKRMSVVERTHTFIIAGLVLQLVVTAILFFGSRRFHQSYGLFSEYVNASLCRRGLEWIPSVFWQFLWSAVFGPFVLLKIRHIHDTHYWAWQTRLAIIACLPGTPLWLVFVYSNTARTAKINNKFVPAGWFLPGLITMQFVTIFFPLLDAIKSKRAIRQLSTASSADAPALTPSAYKTRDDYSMASLEMQINKNLDPLLRWAAEKEFTAENIVFLRAVRDFRKKWNNIQKRMPGQKLNLDQQREQFEDAAFIWFQLVNPLTARFNINIDYRTYSELEAMFHGVRYEPYEDDSSSKSGKSDNVVTPWADAEENMMPLSPSEYGDKMHSPKSPGGLSDIDKLYKIPVTEVNMASAKDETNGGNDQNGDDELVEIPKEFGLEVFDKAYESVKNDVFLNTWVRYEARFAQPGEKGSAANLAAEGPNGTVNGERSVWRTWFGRWSTN